MTRRSLGRRSSGLSRTPFAGIVGAAPGPPPPLPRGTRGSPAFPPPPPEIDSPELRPLSCFPDAAGRCFDVHPSGELDPSGFREGNPGGRSLGRKGRPPLPPPKERCSASPSSTPPAGFGQFCGSGHWPKLLEASIWLACLRQLRFGESAAGLLRRPSCFRRDAQEAFALAKFPSRPWASQKDPERFGGVRFHLPNPS